MKEEITQLIQEAERVGAIKIMTPVEWLRWQNERIEELEKVLVRVKLDVLTLEEQINNSVPDDVKMNIVRSLLKSIEGDPK